MTEVDFYHRLALGRITIAQTARPAGRDVLGAGAPVARRSAFRPEARPPSAVTERHARLQSHWLSILRGSTRASASSKVLGRSRALVICHEITTVGPTTREAFTLMKDFARAEHIQMIVAIATEHDKPTTLIP